VLIVAGLGFKLTIAPLQFYAPDVYQGTTNANAGLLAVAPKIAGVAAFLRLVVIAMPAAAEFAWQLALILALLTMTIGNVCALWQRNLRRLMAYSSIAHGGYLLMVRRLGIPRPATASRAFCLRGRTRPRRWGRSRGRICSCAARSTASRNWPAGPIPAAVAGHGVHVSLAGNSPLADGEVDAWQAPFGAAAGTKGRPVWFTLLVVSHALRRCRSYIDRFCCISSPAQSRRPRAEGRWLGRSFARPWL
jgi:hypothetical protein